jgi:hypothetical protein
MAVEAVATFDLPVFATDVGGQSFSCKNRISRGARKPEKLPGSSIGSLPK